VAVDLASLQANDSRFAFGVEEIPVRAEHEPCAAQLQLAAGDDDRAGAVRSEQPRHLGRQPGRQSVRGDRRNDDVVDVLGAAAGVPERRSCRLRAELDSD
jgi:hypothetical protein